MKLGIMGGTFDPIHVGHLMIAERARCGMGLDHVLFVPAGVPWLRGDAKISPANDRMRMTELAIADNPHFSASRTEIDRPGATYSVDTLGLLRAEHGEDVSLVFIIGADALQHIDRWKDPERLLELCTLAVFQRGQNEYSRPLPGRLLKRRPTLESRLVWMEWNPVDISSSEIRQRVALGRSVRYQVPARVEGYIRRHGLYQSDEEQGRGDTIAQEVKIVGGTAERLLGLALEKGALTYGDFTLTSGKRSRFYFDGRLLSLEPEGAYLIGQALLPVIREAGAAAVGGPTIGADPIVASVAVASHLAGDPMPAFIVRKEAKVHGTGHLIEGPLTAGSKVAIVDDTCTTGGSLFQAIGAAEDAGCEVVKVMALLDRCEGGGDALRGRGYDFTALMVATPEGKIRVADES